MTKRVQLQIEVYCDGSGSALEFALQVATIEAREWFAKCTTLSTEKMEVEYEDCDEEIAYYIAYINLS